MLLDCASKPEQAQQKLTSPNCQVEHVEEAEVGCTNGDMAGSQAELLHDDRSTFREQMDQSNQGKSTTSSSPPSALRPLKVLRMEVARYSGHEEINLIMEGMNKLIEYRGGRHPQERTASFDAVQRSYAPVHPIIRKAHRWWTSSR